VKDPGFIPVDTPDIAPRSFSEAGRVRAGAVTMKRNTVVADYFISRVPR
jgi:hypothetical protein